jgi:hypothetical protein
MATEPFIKTGTTRSAGKHVHLLGKGMESLAGAPKLYRPQAIRPPTEQSKEIERLKEQIERMKQERLKRPERVITVVKKVREKVPNPSSTLPPVPTTCTACGRQFPSRKAAAAHRAATPCGGVSVIKIAARVFIKCRTPGCGRVFDNKRAWGLHNNLCGENGYPCKAPWWWCRQIEAPK